MGAAVWTSSALPTWSGLGFEQIPTLLVVVPITWMLGTIIGLMLPRPRWLTTLTGRWATLSLPYLSSSFSFYLKRGALLLHAGLILRDVWRTFTSPGTFRALLWACWQWLRGNGFSLQLVAQETGSAQRRRKTAAEVQSRPIVEDIDWCVTEADLEFFQLHGEGDEGAPVQPGFSKWEVLMERTFDNAMHYKAWRRTLPTGKTEYKSITTCKDATPHEFTDFYLDDRVRPTWDTMISHHETLETHADENSAPHRLQVVYWRRAFPFSFLSDRDYVIGRRVFRLGESLYGITKAVEHSSRPKSDRVVRMDTYHSMWRSRPVPCPFGGTTPACETLLLHHEDFRIPENLARFAVKHGMAGYVKKMLPAVRAFVDERRTRVPALLPDPCAYGLAEGAVDNVPDVVEQASFPDTPRSLVSINAGTMLSGFQAVAKESGVTSVTVDGPVQLQRSATAPCALAKLRTVGSAVSLASHGSSDNVSARSEKGARGHRGRRARRLSEAGPVQRFATLALAAGVAVAMGHSASAHNLTRMDRRRSSSARL